MANVAVANTDAALAAKTVDLLESDQTITGLKTFSRGAQAPFACASGSTKVANLDADKLDGLDSLAFVKADGTVAMTGALTMTAGQIAFPAVQAAAAGANTFDDYEENTFTPTATMGTSGTVTLDTSFDTLAYTKVGRVVHVIGYLTFTSVSSPLGTLIIGNLPFTGVATPERSGYSAAALHMQGMGATVVSPPVGKFSGGTDLIISDWGTGSPAGFGAGDLLNTTEIWISLTYFAAT